MISSIYTHLEDGDRIEAKVEREKYSKSKTMVLELGFNVRIFIASLNQAEELAFAINSTLQEEGIMLRDSVVKEIKGGKRK